MAETLREHFGVYLLSALLGGSIAEPGSSSHLNLMLLGMIGSSLPTVEWHTNAIEIIHHRGMNGWTEGDKGLYSSMMSSFIPGHNPSIFICSKLIITHQALSSLTTAPYLKFLFVLFFFPL